MKVKLTGYKFLKRHLELEGDEIVESGEELHLDESIEGPLAKVAIEALGYELSNNPTRFEIIKMYKDGAWSDQTIISFPMNSLMDGELGYPGKHGAVCRYIHHAPFLFTSPISEMLWHMKYRGFVTFSYDMQQQLTGISIGAGYAFYAILEGVRGKITDVFFDCRNLESWIAALVVTRYPYPFREESTRLHFDLSPQFEKHFYFYDLQGFKRSFYTDSTIIGIATGWALNVRELQKRILRTCREQNIPFVQYRRDVHEHVVNTWDALQPVVGDSIISEPVETGLISPPCTSV